MKFWQTATVFVGGWVLLVVTGATLGLKPWQKRDSNAQTQPTSKPTTTIKTQTTTDETKEAARRERLKKIDKELAALDKEEFEPPNPPTSMPIEKLFEWNHHVANKQAQFEANKQKRKQKLLSERLEE